MQRAMQSLIFTVFILTGTAASAQFRAAVISRPHLADYDAELRGQDGRVDVEAMVARLKELGVTTYYWLIWHAATDWDDLKLFLPKAAAARIQVWAYLVPPTEGPPGGYPASEPFKMDYRRWADEIARLSLQNPNLTGWIIDDFYANHQLFTPAYVKEMQALAKAINPRLAFLPLMYFPEITAGFVSSYQAAIDGVVVAYPQGREEITDARAILSGKVNANPGQLGCPWNTPTRAGDYVSAGVSAKVPRRGTARLSFSERDDFTGPTADYHFKQVLIDGRVVWEEDVAGGTNAWRRIEMDVTEQARSANAVKVEFRLFDKQGVSNFGVRWSLKDLRTDGLKLLAGLDRPQQWVVQQNGPFEAGFGSKPRTPEARVRLPFIVMTAASVAEFKLRHGEPASPERVAQWLRMCLESWQQGECDGVVTYCLDKAPGSRTFPLVQQLFRSPAPGRRQGS